MKDYYFKCSFENKKLSKDGIVAFYLPVGLTCPFAGECKRYCYAQRGNFQFPTVKAAGQFNYDRLQSNTTRRSVEELTADIVKLYGKGKRRYRIHTSGDFYSRRYAGIWEAVARNVPEMTFYAYTKSFRFFQLDSLPANFTVIQSTGGRDDDRIDYRYPVARIFANTSELRQAGYTDCSKSDITALSTNKVGLIYH
jgi:hypothetical protein